MKWKESDCDLPDFKQDFKEESLDSYWEKWQQFLE
jgi:hypothetical protein